MKLIIRLTATAALAAAAVTALAQGDLTSVWRKSVLSNPASLAQHLQFVQDYQVCATRYADLKAVLDRAPRQDMGKVNSGYVVSLPGPDGALHQFMVAEYAMMTDKLRANTTSRTYRVRGIDDPYAVGVLDTGANGFHGFVRSPKGDFIIDPVNLKNHDEYVIYYRMNNFMPKTGFQCRTLDTVQSFRLGGSGGVGALGAEGLGGNLKTVRLAMNATVEYTAVFGGVAQATAAVVTSVNRVNAVYEIDSAIRMNLVRNNPYLSEPDGFDNFNGGLMLQENQDNCDTNVGDANYDMGHVFSTGGGGVAFLNAVGVTGSKAKGVTGLPNPVGDDFDIDFVAHEMGHQWGGHHTFNGTSGNCGGGNRTDVSAYEPGSGTTIMAYAGICAAEDIQPHSDPYFHYRSLEQIWAWRNNTASGGSLANNGNTPPVANAGPDVTIPQNTPYRLVGTGTDADNDALTFCWEQYDLGTATSNPTDISTGPLVRSKNPATSTMRFLPTLSNVLTGGSDIWEKMPTSDRTMTWRLTVRDNRTGGGAIDTDTTTVTVAGAPFRVNAPTGGADYAGNSSVPVAWTVGGGSSASKVNIRLSTDGGNSYGVPNGTTLLLANAPNTGSASVTLPNINATNCRIIVEAVGSIFYDITKADFKIHKVTLGPPKLIAIGTSPVTVVGGTPLLGSVFVSPAPVTDLTVSLVDNSALLTTPASVVVPAGAESGIFNLKSNPVSATATIKVTATYGGISKITYVTLNPAPAISALTLDKSTLYGGQSTMGTVTLASAANGYAAVSLKSNKTVVVPDAIIYIASGGTTGRFVVNTTAVNLNVVATITAKVGANTKTVTLNLSKMPVLSSVSLLPASVKGGLDSTGTVTLTKPAIGPMTVVLNSSSIKASVGTTVDVPNGATSATFNVHTFSVTVTTSATISGTFNGVTKTATLTITP